MLDPRSLVRALYGGKIIDMQLWQLVDMLEQMSPEQLTSTSLTAKLAGVQFDDASFEPYLSWKPGGYTRNGVHRTQAYEIILMAWDAGAISPVHGHSDQTCWLGVHSGRLAIESYACKQSTDRGRTGSQIAVELRETAILGPGDIEREIAGLDVHRVYNAGAAQERAISLHIYARPFDSCITYDVTRQQAALYKLAYSRVGPPVCRP